MIVYFKKKQKEKNPKTNPMIKALKLLFWSFYRLFFVAERIWKINRKLEF